MIKDFGTRAELEGSGIIGWTKFLIGKAPVVMPSQIYWNALKTWNILRPQEAFDRAPDRNELHAQWEQLVPHPTSVRHSDGPALQSEPDLFDDVPEAPRDWTHNNHSLRLKLTKKEAKAIRSRWNTIRVAINEKERRPLLALLANSSLPIFKLELWDPEIASIADPDDRPALKRARQAASLVCLGRALYAAMVEELRETDSKSSTDRKHRERLKMPW
jgi:hypothetical protein